MIPSASKDSIIRASFNIIMAKTRLAANCAALAWLQNNISELYEIFNIMQIYLKYAKVFEDF